LAEFELCPTCDGKLEEGDLGSLTSLWWINESLDVREQLEDTSFKGARLQGQRCTKCRLIILEYKDYTFKEAKLSGTKWPHCGAIYQYSEDSIIDNRIKCQNCIKEFRQEGRL